VATPLGADFFIGTPESEDHRISNVIPPPPLDPAALGASATGIAVRTFTNPPLDASQAHHGWWRRAEIPAANGHGNARSVATIQSVIAGRGQSAGVRLLSAEGTDAIFEEQANGTDLALGVPIRFGLGYGLGNEFMPLGPRACFWGGYGGSLIVIDQEADLAICYVMNRMESGLVGDTRGAAIVMAVVGALAP
jgi:CubicO group peptidase (beta-lactamase class C family)